MKLKTPKKCSCGKVHHIVAPEFKISTDESYHGIYWNCSCGSTMMVRETAVETVAV